MKPIREIVVREYLPGDYEIISEGRTYTAQSHGALCNVLRNLSSECGRGGPIRGYNGDVDRPWGEDVDYLKERADA